MPKRMNTSLIDIEKERIDKKSDLVINSINDLRGRIGGSTRFTPDHLGSPEFVETIYWLLDFALLKKQLRTPEGEEYFSSQLHLLHRYSRKCVALYNVLDSMFGMAENGNLSATTPSWLKRPERAYTNV